VRRDGDSYVITGHKIWTSWADESDRCLLLGRTVDDGPRHRNLGMFLVDMHQPGIEVRPIRKISGASTFSEVFFDGARVTEADRVGGETDGWKMAMSVLMDERGPIEAITRYMNLSRLADLLTGCCAADAWLPEHGLLVGRVEAVRWQALRSLENTLTGHREPTVNATMKLAWSHTWQDIARAGALLGCAVHGPTWDKQYLDSRAASIFSGSTQVQNNILAERVLGLPR
jgi:alkylation response protein AidB-like acyl-CoA dehydrogenase